MEAELRSIEREALLEALDEKRFMIGPAVSGLSKPARAAISMAYHDLLHKTLDSSTSSHFTGDLKRISKQLTMVTLGHSELADIPLKMKELPRADVLKVKLGSSLDRETLALVTALDPRSLMLDANQGWDSVDDAMRVLEQLSDRKVVGIEQPFAKERWDLHKELSERTRIPVYADESIQGIDDLINAPGVFGGVNLKLMKCGGLDVAAEMIRSAQDLGLKIMLGSMSESSLGCGAMAGLLPYADLLDLDGPWLIQNDPFEGLRMANGRLTIPEGPGLGIDPRAEVVLDWRPIGA